MYKKFKSKVGNTYIYDNVSNNIYHIEDIDTIAQLPDVGETRLLETIDKDLYTNVYSTCDFDSLYSEIDLINDAAYPSVLVIEMTQQCNLRCEYCIYSGAYHYERIHNNTMTSKETLDSIINKWFIYPNHPENVSFYGGEPLLNFNGIAYFVSRMKEKAIDVEYYITTNGTLLGIDEIQDFLIKHNFHINISYDGLNHDLYRKDKNNKETRFKVEQIIERMLDKNPEFVINNVRLSVTLAPPYNLIQNADYFESHSSLSKLRIIINTVNQDDNCFTSKFDMVAENEKLSHDYHELANRYICSNNQSQSNFLQALFGRSINRIDGREMIFSTKWPRLGCCAPGKQRVFVTCEENCFMCERVGNFGQIGTVKTGIDFNTSRDLQKQLDLLMYPLCTNCYLSRICDYCFSVFREGKTFASINRIKGLCDIQRKWYDLMFYIYLSKKEQEIY